jgi:hypothetical protein
VLAWARPPRRRMSQRVRSSLRATCFSPEVRATGQHCICLAKLHRFFGPLNHYCVMLMVMVVLSVKWATAVGLGRRTTGFVAIAMDQSTPNRRAYRY